jgi:hypothetical protein
MYDYDIEAEEDRLEKLREKQAAQVKRQGQGGTQGGLNATQKKKDKK